jgi:hypothetical protein
VPWWSQDRQAVDRFPLPRDDPRYAPQRQLTRYLQEAGRQWDIWTVGPGYFPAGKEILEAKRDDQIGLVHAALVRLAWHAEQARRHNGVGNAPGHALYRLLAALLSRQLPYAREDIVALVRAAVDCYERGAPRGTLYTGAPFPAPLPALLRHVERDVSQHGLTSELRSLLERLRQFVARAEEYADARRLGDRIDTLLGVRKFTGLPPGEPWVDALLHDLSTLEPSAGDAWTAFVQHARSLVPARPPAKWLNTAKQCVEAIGPEEFKQRVIAWLSQAESGPNRQMIDPHAELLKGIAWSCALLEDDGLARSLGQTAEACFRKLAGIGPRSVKAGNACLLSLGEMPGREPVAQLARLSLRVKHRPAQAMIQQALEAAAQRAGLPREELEELSTPTYGMEAPGVLREALGEYLAEITVVGTQQLEWRWITSDGKPQKSTPARLKEVHAEELKSLKRSVDDLQKMLPAQRDRIERLLLSEREWPFETWRERYLEHPLVAPVARRLIWHFQSDAEATLGIWNEGSLVDELDRAIPQPSADTRVRLWHPLGAAPERVLRWRTWLEEHGVTQPFKQAHREVYILTDAEVATDTYSNRFAAHLLRQHQLNALCRQRGWEYRLQGGFDSGYEPFARLMLPRWRLSAEFWVDAVDDGNAVSDAGIYLYVATDQVRFCELDGAPRRLADVPALLLSEVMRDVDLFVGVASIGNDPTWQDRGENRTAYDYWQRYSFGDLSATAATRRDLLERLLPKLKIASRCRLDGKFLIVRGDLRTYKIHLGSSNILMEPNDQYLCIVPDRSSQARGDAGRVFLPFEGDQTLSVILSKAFLLAEDTRITDRTILGQIRR